MNMLSMRTGTQLSLVVSQNAPAGWACLGWTCGATAVPIPPAWEPGQEVCRIAARAANRAGGQGRRHGLARSTASCRRD